MQAENQERDADAHAGDDSGLNKVGNKRQGGGFTICRHRRQCRHNVDESHKATKERGALQSLSNSDPPNSVGP